VACNQALKMGGKRGGGDMALRRGERDFRENRSFGEKKK